MKKHLFFITPIVFLSLSFLKEMHILQNFWGQPITIIIATLVLSILISKIETNAEHNADQLHVHYENLDFVRFLFAIFVLLLHMRPFLGYNDQLDLAFNNIVSRICVPLFFMTTGYFCAKKQQVQPAYIKSYIKNMIPTYLVWSILYLPFGMYALLEMGIDGKLMPLALLVGLLYLGTYYHLWYFPALFFSLWILNIWKKHFSMRSLLVLSFLLLCFGASETYYGILPLQLQHLLSTYYFKYFYTTRNFLFFGLFYVTLGYCIGLKKNAYVSYSFVKFLLCCFLLVAEVFFLQSTDRLDSNILLSCVPLSYFLFITLIHTKSIVLWKQKIALRNLYKYVYFLHPAVISLTTYLLFSNTPQLEGRYWIQITIVVAITYILTLAIVTLKKKNPKATRWL